MAFQAIMTQRQEKKSFNELNDISFSVPKLFLYFIV